MRLVFDTETTGLPNNREPPDHPSQPHLVQLCALLLDPETQRERSVMSVIIKPDGWTVPPDAYKVHGITTEIAEACGVPLIVAMAMFSNLVRQSTCQVAHNVDFDMKIILAACARLKRPLQGVLNPRCTVNMTTPLLKLPPTERMIAAGFGSKWKSPTLAECVRFFFDEELESAHDAFVDARACARIYFEVLRRTADAPPRVNEGP